MKKESSSNKRYWNIGSVQFSSVSQSCLTLCDPMDCSMPGFPVHYQFLEPTQTHGHSVGNAIQSSSVVPFSSHLKSIPASGSFQMSHFFFFFYIRWPKYWSFSFSTSPSNEHLGLISFSMHWLDFLCSPRDS